MAIDKIGSSIIETVETLNKYNAVHKESAERGNLQNVAKQEAKLSVEAITDIVKELNEATKNLNERITFDYNEKANRVIVRVLDSNTNEVVREIPPRDIVKVLEHIQEYMGMLFDESR